MTCISQSDQQRIFNEQTYSQITYYGCRLAGWSGFSYSEIDDLQQELSIHLLTKAHRYSPGKSCVSTFVNCVLRSSAVSMWRKRQRGPKAGIYREYAGYMVGLPCKENTDEDARLDVRDAFKHLHGIEHEVASRLMEGRTSREIMNDLRISRHYLRIVKRDLRRKFGNLN